jgi:hypothetical protein
VPPRQKPQHKPVQHFRVLHCGLVVYQILTACHDAPRLHRRGFGWPLSKSVVLSRSAGSASLKRLSSRRAGSAGSPSGEEIVGTGVAEIDSNGRT